jgi:hypothetical protein
MEAFDFIVSSLGIPATTAAMIAFASIAWIKMCRDLADKQYWTVAMVLGAGLFGGIIGGLTPDVPALACALAGMAGSGLITWKGYQGGDKQVL